MEKLDLLIPLELPGNAGFSGRGGRRGNEDINEADFSFGRWDATYHNFNGRAYIVVRCGLPHDEIEALLPQFFELIAGAAAILDVSIRTKTGPLRVLDSNLFADLSGLSVFPSGENPRAMFAGGSIRVSMPVETFGDALGSAIKVSNSDAFRIFSDIDFEATTSSQFVLLATILEILAERKQRDEAALELLNKWTVEAKDAGCEDLTQALEMMRQESIGSSIGTLVANAALKAGLTEDRTAKLKARARKVYGKRSGLVHGGKSVSVDDLASLRSIVRLVLTGNIERSPFSPAGADLSEA